MGLLYRVLTLLSIIYLLGCCYMDEGVSGERTFRIVRKGRRTGNPGNFNNNGIIGGENIVSVSVSPEQFHTSSSIYTTPTASMSSSSEEELLTQSSSNEALGLSSLEQGTTTELSSLEEQLKSEEIGISEDYIFSTATHIPTISSQETTGPTITNNNNNNDNDNDNDNDNSGNINSNESNNEVLDNDKKNSDISIAIADRGFDIQTESTDDIKNHDDLVKNNEINTNHNQIDPSSYFKTTTGTLDQQQIENQEHFQVQTQSPSSIQEPKASYEQIVALHQPINYQQPERQDFPNARQYDQQGGYGDIRTILPQPRNIQQPQQLYQQPSYERPQQLYQKPQQQQEEPQQLNQPQKQQTQEPQQFYQKPQQQHQEPQQLYQQVQHDQKIQEPQQIYPQPQQIQKTQEPQQLYQNTQQPYQNPQQQHQVPQQLYQQPQQLQVQEPQQLYQKPQEQHQVLQQFYQQPQQPIQEPQQLYQQPQGQTQQSPQPQSTTTQPQLPTAQPQVQPQLPYQQEAQTQLYPQPKQQSPHHQPIDQQFRQGEQIPEPTNYYPPRQFYQNNQQNQYQNVPQTVPVQNRIHIEQSQEQLPREYQQEQEQPSYRPIQYQQNVQIQPEPQIQYGVELNHQPQHQQNYIQGQQQQRALYQLPSDRNAINLNSLIVDSSSHGTKFGKVGSTSDIQNNEDTSVVLEGLNDNVVDSELLERVQQIIEDHERQQKDLLQRLRSSKNEREGVTKDNGAFTGTPPNEFQPQQPNINSAELNENSSPNTSINNDNKESERQEGTGGYSNPRFPHTHGTINSLENKNNEESILQQPQQRTESQQIRKQPAQLSRTIPQSYFRQDPQTSYLNIPQNSPEAPQSQDYSQTQENQGRVFNENKNIEFQPAILTSHFVESLPGRKNEPQTATLSQGDSSTRYLPTAQRNTQSPNLQSYQGIQKPVENPIQNIYNQGHQPPQPQQSHINASPRELKPAFSVTQVQQPDAYPVQQQRQHMQQIEPRINFPSNEVYTNYPPQIPQVPDRHEIISHTSPVQQPEQERRDIGDGSQENSLEYFQKQGGYSQPQQVYLLPTIHQPSPVQYQQPQLYQNFQQDTNVGQTPQENPSVITRTIVIHEQPTTIYGADNNRAIITAADLRGSDPSQNQYSQDVNPQSIFQPNHQQQQQQQQPQQYQYLTASAQLNLAPEIESNLPPESYQPQNTNVRKEITPPRPIYGIPLAPVLGPNDNLDSQQYQNIKPNYLPLLQQQQQGNSIYESSSDITGGIQVPSWSSNLLTVYGASENVTPAQSDYVGDSSSNSNINIANNNNNNTPISLVTNTVSLPTREYSSPSLEPIIEQTTSKNLPYGRRIDRNIRKRFSSAITSPLAGFFSVKSKST